MFKAYKNDLPLLCNNHSFIFHPLSLIHFYSTRSSISREFFVQRTRRAKTNPSLNAFGIKVYNNLCKDIKDRATNVSNSILAKLLKKDFLDSKY